MQENNQNINPEVADANSPISPVVSVDTAPVAAKRNLKDHRILMATIAAFIVGLIALVTAFVIGQNTKLNNTNSVIKSTQTQQVSSNSASNSIEQSTTSVAQTSTSATKSVASTTSKAASSAPALTKSIELPYQHLASDPVQRFLITYPTSSKVSAEVVTDGSSILIFGSYDYPGTNLTIEVSHESSDEGVDNLSRFTKIVNPNHPNIYRSTTYDIDGNFDLAQEGYQQLVGTNLDCMGEVAPFCMSSAVLAANSIEYIYCVASSGADLTSAQLAWCDSLMSNLKIQKQ